MTVCRWSRQTVSLCVADSISQPHQAVRRRATLRRRSVGLGRDSRSGDVLAGRRPTWHGRAGAACRPGCSLRPIRRWSSSSCAAGPTAAGAPTAGPDAGVRPARTVPLSGSTGPRTLPASGQGLRCDLRPPHDRLSSHIDDQRWPHSFLCHRTDIAERQQRPSPPHRPRRRQKGWPAGSVKILQPRVSTWSSVAPKPRTCSWAWSRSGTSRSR